MQYHMDDRLVLSLANLLQGSRVDSARVEQALALLCRAAGFEFGLVYEVGSAEEYCLAERYPVDGVGLPQTVNAQELAGKMANCQQEQLFYTMELSDATSPLRRRIMEIFSAKSLLGSLVMDDAGSLNGFVVLFNTEPRRLPSPEFLEWLAVPFSLFLRHVETRMYRRRIRQGQTALESVLDNTGIDIYVNDFYNHDILYVNKSMAAPYGGQGAFLGKKCWQVLFPGQTGPCEFCPQIKIIDEQGQPTKVYTWDYQRLFDGAWFRVFSAAFRWGDGRLAHVVSSAEITDNKRNEAIIERLANYDELTGLPNRRMLVKECERRIDNATTAERGYLLFFDIDGFKAINDSYGHTAGDEFLILLGEFFLGIPLLKNAIYRNGGDEFVAIIDGTGVTKANVLSLGRFIHERFKKPWRLKKGEVFSNTSIGVVGYPEGGHTAEELLQKADMAMYRAKNCGGGRLCFDHELEQVEPTE